MHTGYVSSAIGTAKPWLFAPVRPGETLAGLEMDLSVQMDRLVQDIFCPPLVVDCGIFLVPLTLLQSIYGDDYLRAFAGEVAPVNASSGGSDAMSARVYGQFPAGGRHVMQSWRGLKRDLVAQICRTYFSRENVPDTTPTPDGVDHVEVGPEFLPTAAGQITVETDNEGANFSEVLELTETWKADRLAETTYLEALHRFDVSGREARHIPEVVAWERRLLHPRQDLITTGSAFGAAGEFPADQTGVLERQFTVGSNALRFISGGVPASSLGVRINEHRSKRFRVTDPSFLVGITLVRWATHRTGFFNDDTDRTPGWSHAELMTLADDWCPPGTGFNDAVRPVGNSGTVPNGFSENQPAGVTAAAVIFDPMMYLFYGEAYYSINTDKDGHQRDSTGSVYDMLGNDFTTQGDTDDSEWSVITKSYVRLEVDTDLTL